MRPELYDIVRLKSPRPQLGLQRDATGTIVMVYEHPNRAYEVEFLDREGKTIGLLTLEEDELERVDL